MVRWRVLVAATTVLIGGVGAALATTHEPERVTPPEGRSTPAPEPSPAVTETPETPADTDRPPTEDRPKGRSTTERHVISGSGSIAVVSGNVEQGESSGGTRANYIGPSPRPPASSP